MDGPATGFFTQLLGTNDQESSFSHLCIHLQILLALSSENILNPIGCHHIHCDSLVLVTTVPPLQQPSNWFLASPLTLSPCSSQSSLSKSDQVACPSQKLSNGSVTIGAKSTVLTRPYTSFPALFTLASYCSPIAGSVPAALASLLFSKHAKHTLASGTLYALSPLAGMPCAKIPS